MSTIDTSSLYSSSNVSLDTSGSKSTSELTSDDFIDIMLAQLANQDPTDPTDTDQLVSQVSDLSTMDSMQNMEASMNTVLDTVLSSQSMQSTSLIGNRVQVPSSQGELTTDQDLSGSVILDEPVSDLSISIYDASGARVDNLNLGNQAGGEVAFSWNGSTASGQAEPGFYSVVAEGTRGGETTVLETQMMLTVDSVTLGSNGTGTRMTLSNGSQVSTSDIVKVA